MLGLRARAHARIDLPALAVFLFIALPWLNPFSPGPMSAAVPLLFAGACAAGLLAVYGSGWHPGSHAGLLRIAAGAWLSAALLSAVLGLLQYGGASAVFSAWVNSTALGEAYANLRQRNLYASLMNIGLLALLWWTAQARLGQLAPTAATITISPPESSTSTPRHLGTTLAAALLLGVGNAVSSSRTGLMQLLLVAALVLCWGGWRQPGLRRVLLACMLAYGVASFALPWLVGLDPFASGAWARLRAGDSACASRLTLWGNVLQLIAQKPWFGWGWGELDYAHFITLYPGGRFCDILDNAHNLPLHLAVELGVPAAVLVCGAALVLAWRARPWREADPSRQLAWGILAVILLHSLLEYPLWYGPFQLAFGLCVWYLWRSSLQRDQLAVRPLTSSVTVLVAALLLAAIGYAGWDYYRVSQLYRLPKMRAPAYQHNTLEKVRDSRLFQDQVRFAELTTTPLTPANAAHVHDLAADLLHFSPEPRVIEKLIESAQLLGRADEAAFYLARYQAAFAVQQARWVVKTAHEANP